MKWKTGYIRYSSENDPIWYPHFAWTPVKISKSWTNPDGPSESIRVWWQHVEKSYWFTGAGDGVPLVVYRLLPDSAKNPVKIISAENKDNNQVKPLSSSGPC